MLIMHVLDTHHRASLRALLLRKVKRGDLGHGVTWDGGVIFQSCFEITKSFKILFFTHKHLCFVSL